MICQIRQNFLAYIIWFYGIKILVKSLRIPHHIVEYGLVTMLWVHFKCFLFFLIVALCYLQYNLVIFYTEKEVPVMERTPTVEQLKYLVVPKIAAHWKVQGIYTVSTSNLGIALNVIVAMLCYATGKELLMLLLIN